MSSDFESEDERPVKRRKTTTSAEANGAYSDLYLDTVNRAVLDFDFEKLCSVTLSNINVYACLVCGKYFQGRGTNTQAYVHALEVDHHVYINMESKKIYVLPEGYEVHNKSLDDIRYVVDPTFGEKDVKRLDKDPIESTDLSNKRYRPGFVGMNNIKANDYLNVVVQCLAHVAPLRNFLFLHKFPHNAPQLAVRFSTLVRKIWNAKAFRNHVSPHELLQEIAIRSSKKFTLTQQSDPVEFLSWFLNHLHMALSGSPKKRSVVYDTFQGKLRQESQVITEKSDIIGSRLRFDESEIITNQMSYLFLTLDLPPAPIFRDSIEAKNIIPQVPLTTLLHKYGGLQASERADRRLRHRLLHPLPPFLLLHIKRFSQNKFVSERNPTIVTFPSPRGLDMSPYVEPNPKHPASETILYDLVANIILDTEAASTGEDSNAADAANKAVGGEGERVAWKVQLRDKAVSNAQRSDLAEWLEIQDLYVTRTEAETLFTREGYLMVWERRRDKTKSVNGSANGVVNGKGKSSWHLLLVSNLPSEYMITSQKRFIAHHVGLSHSLMRPSSLPLTSMLKITFIFALLGFLAPAVLADDQGILNDGLSETTLKDKLSDVIASSPLLTLHRSLCEIPSVSEDELAVADWLIDFLESHNFTVSTQNVPHSGSTNSTQKRLNIYAVPNAKAYGFSTPASSSSPKVLLSSHIDTVPPHIPYSLSTPHKGSKFEPKKVLIAGRGTVDDKACVAAQTQTVLDILASSDKGVHPADLALLFVVGEEKGGDGMKHFSESKLYSDTNADYKAIIFGEPTEGKLASGHKGIMMAYVEAQGKAAHSGYPWLGRSANSMILPALMVLDKLGDIPEEEGGLPRSEKYGKTTVNVGHMEGGVAANVVPEYAYADVAFRLAGGTIEEARKIVQNAISAADPDHLLNLNFSQGYAPIELDTDVDGFESMTVNYGTDIPNLDVEKGVKRYLYGPGSILVAHGRNEGLTVGSMEQAVKDYKKLVKHALSL